MTCMYECVHMHGLEVRLLERVKTIWKCSFSNLAYVEGNRCHDSQLSLLPSLRIACISVKTVHCVLGN